MGTSEDCGILESNSFNMNNLDALGGELHDLVERRRVLGPCYRLFYQKPLHLVRGRGTRLLGADGEEYLDMYNNIPSMGHSNPAVTEAVTKQLQLLNTHTRYVHENILNYAEDLLSTMPDEINRIMFMCSGSEANDLAVRCAQLFTGGEGVIVTGEAYHGNTALISGLSPSIGKSVAMSRTMRMIPSPDTYRLGTEDLGPWMCEQISLQIADMRRHGIEFAGVLFDDIFSSDGVIPSVRGFLKPVVDLVHREGGVYIADEVQPGFCRTGDAFWGFARHGIVPDIVTMGKPMANGIPCSAMAIRTSTRSRAIPCRWLPRRRCSISSARTISWRTRRKWARSCVPPCATWLPVILASPTCVAPACSAASKWSSLALRRQIAPSPCRSSSSFAKTTCSSLCAVRTATC